MRTAFLPEPRALLPVVTERAVPAAQAFAGPLLSCSVLLGFSCFAAHALGLPQRFDVYSLLVASALFMHGADATLPALRTERLPAWPALSFLFFGAFGMAWSLPGLSRETWLVLAGYLPLGLLWTVPCLPTLRWSERRIVFRAPCELVIRPYLSSGALAFASVGVPAAQSKVLWSLPLGASALLSADLYAVLALAFVIVATSATALTLEAADFHDLPAASPFAALRLRLLWLQALSVQFAFALVLALGAHNRTVAAMSLLGASYTLVASALAYRKQSRWSRALICAGQGPALLCGLFLARL